MNNLGLNKDLTMEDIRLYANSPRVYRKLKNAKSLYTVRRPIKVKEIRFTDLYNPSDSFTDGKTVYVGFFKEELEEDISLVDALIDAKIGHEMGHVNFTNFTKTKDGIDEFRNYANSNYPEKKNQLVPLYSHLINILEDGRIERLMALNYKSLGVKLALLNMLMFKEPVNRNIFMEKPLNTMLTEILLQAKIREVSPEFKNSKDYNFFEEKIMPLVEEARYSNKFSTVLENTKKIIILIEPLVSQDPLPQFVNDSNANRDSISNNTSYQGQDPNGDGDSNFGEMEEDKNTDYGKSHEKEGENNQQEKGGNSSGNGSGENGEKGEEENTSKSNSSSGSRENSKEGSEESSGGSSKDLEEGKEGEEDENGSSSNAGSDFEGSNNSSKSSSNNSSVSEKEEETYEEKLKKLLEEAKKERSAEENKEIQDTLKKLKEAHEKSMKENKSFSERKTRELSDDVFGHEFIMRKSIPTRGYPDQNVMNEANSLKKELEKIFMNKKTFNLRFQERGALDPNALIYSQMGITDNVFKTEGTNIERSFAVDILLDTSGSMEGDNIRNAFFALSVLEESLKDLCSLRMIMYDTGYSTTKTEIIKDFKDKSVNYSTTLYEQVLKNSNSICYNANAEYINIDVEREILKNRPETDKIMFILSDGLPRAVDGVSNPKEELKKTIEKVKRDNIKVVPIFFESWSMDDAEDDFRYMYKDNIIFCTPDKIYTRLKRIMRDIIKS